MSRAVEQGEILVRGVEKDKRPHLLGKRPYKPLKIHRGIRVGAARDEESARDGLKKMDRFYGFFTWYWVENLERAQAGETWNDVFKRTYAQVFKRDYTQVAQNHAPQPQIEGEHHQQVLGGGFTPLPLRIPIRIAGKTGKNKIRVGIEAGLLAGVTEGSKYCLYKPEESNPPNLPCMTIGKVKPFVSYAQKLKPRGIFKIGDLVVEKSHAYHFMPSKVYLEADFPKEDEPLLKAIRAAFQPNPDGTQPLSAYQLTNDPYDTDLRLYLLRPKLQDGQLIPASPGNILPKSFPNQPPELWILTPEQRLLKSLKIPFTNLKKGIKLLQDNLKKMARIRELKALQSPRGNSNLPVAVQTYLFKPCLNGQNCVPLSNLGKHRKTGPYRFQEIEKLTLNQGDILLFTLHNESEQDYYCYLINISFDGTILALFPLPWEPMEFARVSSGKKERVKSVLKMKQVGEETLKLIISTQPIDISLLEQSQLITREGLNPLEQLLVNAAHGLRDETLIEIDKWATGQVTFKVK
ncbi:hypothetical protein PN36_25455 [Candidatus Thiomargarita nelsonii]|uniref:DUF4384 domain-containing protein n=1 Tax=Candidatus Thiomargarita nelsonii TaxID=1003181 RepID=A0A4E0QM25_9GAMM|nr:hypothetical protein PN36_25455 [Candidatus Thiomargarita nelsonii]